ASATIAQCRTRYRCDVIDRLPPQVPLRQSPDVDYVSGATQSADAFYGAVVAALGKAKFFPASFQQIVFGGVPLHHFAPRTAPRPPFVDGFDLLPSPAPQSGFQHELPQRLAPDPELVFAGEEI